MKKSFTPKKNPKTSWEGSSSWYGKLMSEDKSYYHEELILPKMAEKLKSGAICDFACGQGILFEKLSRDRVYLGIDIAPSLIALAQKRFAARKADFIVHDLTTPITFSRTFDHTVSILAIQNIEEIAPFLENVKRSLKKGGRLHLVMNHPCFRVPRQSAWGQDEKNKIQYRRIDRYMSEMEIPIETHPGRTIQGRHTPLKTISFHRPLQFYVEALKKAGFAVSSLEEWVSPKKSMGSAAKKEDLARNEIPLFLYIEALQIM